MKIGITERGDPTLDLTWLDRLPEVDGAIIITKDPGTLKAILKGFKLTKAKLVVHCTITGYGGSNIEPNAPKPSHAWKQYHDLYKLLDGRVVLRIDPVYPTPLGYKMAKMVLRQKIAGGRVRVSFLDLYPHVKARLEEDGDKPDYDFHAPLPVRQHYLEALQRHSDVSIEVCGEPGIECVGCVSKADLDMMGLTSRATATGRQRPDCGCLSLKTELLTTRGRCKMGCLYCYWRG